MLSKTILFIGSISFSLKVYCAPLATINGQSITKDQFGLALKSLGSHGTLVGEDLELRERFLNHLIEVELKAQAAKIRGLQNSPEFKLKLAQAEKHILASIYEELWMSEHTNENSLKNYYEANLEMFHRQEVQVSHILIRDEVDAQKVLGLVQENPASFKALVREYSISDTESQGLIGWLSKGSQPIPFEKVVFTAPIGQVHPHLVKTVSGYHVVKIENVRYHHKKHFSALRSDVKRALTRAIQHQLDQDLKKQASLSIDLKALKSYQ